MVPPTRRALLKTASVVAAGSLAGCFRLFEGDLANESYPTYRRWLPSDEVEWTFDPRSPPVFARPAALSEVDALSLDPTEEFAYVVPPPFETTWLETALHTLRQGFGTLAVDRETVTSSLPGEPVLERDGAVAYETDRAVVAVDEDRYGHSLIPDAIDVTPARVAEPIVEIVSSPPEPDAVELDRPGYDPTIRTVGDASFVWFDHRRDSLRVFAPEVDRVVHGWNVGADRTALRSAVGFPSEDAVAPDAVEDWTASVDGPDFSVYDDLSVSTQGRVVLVDAEAETGDVRFLTPRPTES